MSRLDDVMRGVRLALITVLLVPFTGCAGPAGPSASPTGTASASVDAELAALTTELISALVDGDYNSAVALFDDQMLRALPADDLAAAWRQVTEQAGDYESEISRRQESTGQYRAVVVTAHFARAALDVRVVFDADRRIAGLFFQPPSAPSADPTTWQPPPYADADRVSEADVTVGEAPWALPGTLTTPAGVGRFPAVVLVHGSGPHDRDETIGPNKPFRDLALGLASRGIAVLAYDKRTFTYRSAMAQAGDITVQEEVVADAALAVRLLRTTDGIDPDRVFVLGHSLGGTLAPRIARASDALAGLVIVAGAARPLEDLILEQHTYLAQRDGTVTAQERAELDRVAEQVASIKDPALSSSTPAEELLGVPASYWLDLRGYDPAASAAELAQPILVLQGERDYQVTMADFALWSEALAGRGDVTLTAFPSLNHLMMDAPPRTSASPGASELGGPEEYEVSGHVSRDVVEAIAAFVLD